ncbi:MAG TPA: MarR family transcriptional regulator [Solirubrobacteraceae bacterium]|nr:MarR family transcriptional regulator [Solirubrobacteraceae bacterium]
MAATSEKAGAGTCKYVIGDEGLARLPEEYTAAWIGLLEVAKRMSRELDGELEAAYGIGLSSLELLGRLAAAPERRMQLSSLAAAANLSLSRVSRIVDALEGRALLTRRQCPSDARSVEAELTGAGLALAREAQALHVAAVQERFFGRLQEDEIATLAEVFSRLAPGASEECSAER